MCGRYASATGRAELLDYFDAEADTEEPDEPNYNVAPTDPVTAIVTRPRRRLLRTMRWGLVPSWAKDASGGSRLINARIETAADKPAFRAAASKRRCLLPADGYYEWQPIPVAGEAGGKGRVRKQAWYFTSVDGRPLAMAGLWEVWRQADGAALLTASVITGDAVDEFGQVHDRSPMLIAADDWSAWLDPSQADAAAALALARPAAGGQLLGRPVGPEVGNVANNGPGLIAEVTSPDATLVRL